MCIIKLKFHSDNPNEECRLDYVMTILKRFYHSGKMTPMQYRTFKGEVCHGYVKHFYNWCSKRGYDVKTLERRYSHRYYDYTNILVTMIEKSPEISAICDLEKKYPELINGGVENERNQTE